MSAEREHDGEIESLADTPLQASSLDEHTGVASAAIDGSGYGDDADERAIKRVLAQLRVKSSLRTLSEEQLTERAEDLYALLCRQVLADGANEQAVQIAALFGEDLARLRARLR
jgi:hypothetical protein